MSMLHADGFNEDEIDLKHIVLARLLESETLVENVELKSRLQKLVDKEGVKGVQCSKRSERNGVRCSGMVGHKHKCKFPFFAIKDERGKQYTTFELTTLCSELLLTNDTSLVDVLDEFAPMANTALASVYHHHHPPRFSFLALFIPVYTRRIFNG